MKAAIDDDLVELLAKSEELRQRSTQACAVSAALSTRLYALDLWSQRAIDRRPGLRSVEPPTKPAEE